MLETCRRRPRACRHPPPTWLNGSAGTGYLTDDGLATIGYLALSMQRPLLLEGEPGTGKTALAEALAEALGLDLIRLQCHEGIDASQALYDWDFARQILHLRTVEATKGGDGIDADEVEKSLFDERFLLARPILQRAAGEPGGAARRRDRPADDEFEAFLLEVLSTNQVTIPEYGTVTAATPPIVVLTSNRTREVHDALKRRCLYHWVDHPGLAARDRDRAAPAARGPAGAGRAGGTRDRPAARPRRPGEAARRRRDARLGSRAAHARAQRARPRDRRRPRWVPC